MSDLLQQIKQLKSFEEQAEIKIQTLGNFVLWRNQEKINDKEWSRDKSMQLFQYFISNRKKNALHKEKIMDHLWEDWDDRDFKVALHGIQKVLEPNRINRTEPNFIIRQGVSYQIDLENNYSKSVRVERRFFSPFTRWAGGVFMENRLQRDSLPTISSEYSLQTFKYNTIDLWAGHSFRIKSDEFNDIKNTNLVTTLRYYKVNYLEDISSEFDAIDFFSNESFWLTGIGLSSRKFVQDEYVFNFAIAEDIPIGKYYGITGGIQHKIFENRLYFGAKATFGNYFKWGYFSTNYEYGSFFKDNKSQQSAFALQINYFTPLIELGKWKVRQFFKSDVIIGSHRLESVGDRISINESNGINGFNDPKFLGTRKMLFSFQSQSYSPWQWAGFRFSPFLNYSLAFLAA